MGCFSYILQTASLNQQTPPDFRLKCLIEFIKINLDRQFREDFIKFYYILGSTKVAHSQVRL